MTEENQRTALAEACPTVFVRATGTSGWNYHNSTVQRVLPCIDGDPLKDLNAIHEAVEVQGEKIIKAMRFWLFEICGQMRAHHATAAEQSKALLKALGLWRDS